MRASLIAILLIAAAAAVPVAARELPGVEPAAVGLSAERLARLDAMVSQAVAADEIAGAVVLVARRGRIAHLGVYGHARRPMRADTLFRIASMTKPVTSVAVMMLYEEGRILLDDPVGRYLPAFDREMQVAVPAGDGYELVPATGPITVRHLLTHTSGISYRFMGLAPLSKLYAEAGITDGLGAGISNAELVRRLAEMPLAHEPGEAFTYGLNTDVLGQLVETVSGVPLDVFMRERIFGPLGMQDTYFEVPEDERHRIAPVYRNDDDGGLTMLPGGTIDEEPVVFTVDYPSERSATRLSGGAGLTSTAADYARFLAMIAGDGEFGGVRILGRKTVELMTSDQVGRLGSESFGGLGFGLGFAHDPGPAGSGRIGSPGVVGWSGFFNTDAFFDPQEELIVVLMTQHYPFGARLLGAYRQLVYQAIVD